MKINPEKTKTRLKHVAPHNRVYIYDASVVMEFMRATFMPTEIFLKNPEIHKGPGALPKEAWKPNVFEDRFSIGDIYTWYLMFRNNKPYTRAIETKFQFGLILSRMRFYKNGFELTKIRVGTAQLNYFAPLVLRAKMSQELRDKYPIKEPVGVPDE